MKLRNKKTGEIFDLDKMPKWLKESIQICATFYSRECEVYEPAEPLIKDEEARGIIRAFAKRCGIKRFAYRQSDWTLRGVIAFKAGALRVAGNVTKWE